MDMAQVKHAMATQARVRYRGIEYYITACIMRLKNTKWIYELELHSFTANSVTIAEMERVEVVE